MQQFDELVVKILLHCICKGFKQIVIGKQMHIGSPPQSTFVLYQSSREFGCDMTIT